MQDAALWRGSLFCGPNRFMRCPRALLGHLTAQRAHRSLDVRFVTYNPAHDPYLQQPHPDSSLLPHAPFALERAERVPLREHANYRFLVHLDGYTASSRLQSLLATNSVVLKQDSYFWA